jgi:hypothetical protein
MALTAEQRQLVLLPENMKRLEDGVRGRARRQIYDLLIQDLKLDSTPKGRAPGKLHLEIDPKRVSDTRHQLNLCLNKICLDGLPGQRLQVESHNWRFCLKKVEGLTDFGEPGESKAEGTAEVGWQAFRAAAGKSEFIVAYQSLVDVTGAYLPAAAFDVREELRAFLDVPARLEDFLMTLKTGLREGHPVLILRRIGDRSVLRRYQELFRLDFPDVVGIHGREIKGRIVVVVSTISGDEWMGAIRAWMVG